jgi:hypothetical protein
MFGGTVIAVAENTALAARIVRALNGQQIDEDVKPDVEPWTVMTHGVSYDCWADSLGQQWWMRDGNRPEEAGNTFRRLYVEKEDVQ